VNSSTYIDSIFTQWDIIYGVATFIIIIVLFGIFSVLSFGKRLSLLFISALFLKLCVTWVFVYLTKYILGGDSLMYYTGASQIANANASTIFEFWSTLNPINLSSEAWSILQGSPVNYFLSIGNSLVGRIGAFFIVIFFDSYTSVSLWFAFLGFLGLLKFYKIGIYLYPKAKTYLSCLMLFMPSLIYWSNGIMKDAICLFLLGVAGESVFKLLVLKRKTFFTILLLLFSLYFLFYIKVYIAVVFIISLIIVVSRRQFLQINNSLLRRLSLPVFLTVSSALLFLSNLFLANQFNKFSGERFLDTIKYHQNVTFGSSTYSLGDFDGTITSFLWLYPSAFFTSLFRPFIWEVHNIFMFLLSLENAFLFLISMYIFIKCGFRKTFKCLIQNDILLYSIVFVVIFGGIVGLSTYNFGNLARYRLPMLPFYILFLSGLIHFHKSRKLVRR